MEIQFIPVEEKAIPNRLRALIACSSSSEDKHGEAGQRKL
jgi:hypothetical protein